MTELSTEVLAASTRRILDVATQHGADDDPRISDFGARLAQLDAQHAELRVEYENLSSAVLADTAPNNPKR